MADQYGGTIGLVASYYNSQPGGGSTSERLPFALYDDSGLLFRFSTFAQTTVGDLTQNVWQIIYYQNGVPTTVYGMAAPPIFVYYPLINVLHVLLHTLEISWKMGSNTAGVRNADGSIKVVMDGTTIFDITGIALGRNSLLFPKWTSMVVGPCGGLRSIYIRDISTPAAGFQRAFEEEPFTAGFLTHQTSETYRVIYNQLFPNESNSTVFANAGGYWTRNSPLSPGLADGWVWSNSGAQLSRAGFNPALDAPDNSGASVPTAKECCGDTGTTTDPSTPDDEVHVSNPYIPPDPLEALCAGDGLVPEGGQGVDGTDDWTL